MAIDFEMESPKDQIKYLKKALDEKIEECEKLMVLLEKRSKKTINIESLRNKLSPFMNLVKMLIDTNELTWPFTDSKLNDLFEAELKICEDNYAVVLKYLRKN